MIREKKNGDMLQHIYSGPLIGRFIKLFCYKMLFKQLIYIFIPTVNRNFEKVKEPALAQVDWSHEG